MPDDNDSSDDEANETVHPPESRESFLRRIAAVIELLELDLKRGHISGLARRPWRKPWGGADVRIVTRPETDTLGDLLVVTKHPSAVSRLFDHLRNRCISLMDHLSKYDFYEHLGCAVLEEETPNRPLADVLSAVVHRQIGLLARWTETGATVESLVTSDTHSPGRHAVFAYGSNLDPERMLQRCPEAIALVKARLEGWSFFFDGRGKASVRQGDSEAAQQACVDGGLWLVNDHDLEALDRHEGVKRGYYVRRTLPMKVLGRCNPYIEHAHVYVGADQQIGQPEPDYMQHVANGFAAWGIRPEHRRSVDELAAGG